MRPFVLILRAKLLPNERGVSLPWYSLCELRRERIVSTCFSPAVALQAAGRRSSGTSTMRPTAAEAVAAVNPSAVSRRPAARSSAVGQRTLRDRSQRPTLARVLRISGTNAATTIRSYRSFLANEREIYLGRKSIVRVAELRHSKHRAKHGVWHSEFEAHAAYFETIKGVLPVDA